MNPHDTKRVPLCSLIEPLEARIAPATIRIGAVGVQENITDTEYREFVDPFDPNRGPRPDPFNSISFVNTSTALDPISLAVDPLRTADGNNTYYLRLKAGDQVDQFSDSGNYKPFIAVRRGNVVAFFTDLNGNNEFDANELTGLSLGANVAVDILGNVNGDIVTNLNERGTAALGDDTVQMDGLVNFRQGIRDLRVLGGGVSGNILSGGDILALTVARNVDNVLAGSAAAGTTFDFFTNSAGGEGIANSTARPGKIGASITKALIFSLTDRLEAGSGGAGGAGGALLNIQVSGDTDGFQLLAGAGGQGDVTVNRLNGGVGGGVRNIFITGVADPSSNSPLAMIVKAGAGGDAVNTGIGGAGGRLVNVFVGFEAVGSTVVKSGELGSDSVVIGAGAGGAGKFGGVGGVVNSVVVRVRTPDVTGEEVFVFGGLGGSSLSPGGRAGVGGSVANVGITNQILSADSDILVLGGNGGTTVGNSRGAAGGSIANIDLLGFDLQVIAGDGSDGRIGGVGGTVRDVTILPDEFILTRNFVVNAGRGGNASAGNGGAGGGIDGVKATQSDLEALLINPGIGANGGRGIGGVGGRGGSVINLEITDLDGDDAIIEGIASLRTGKGGDGTRGGGAGGNYALVDIDSHAMNLIATAGDGGSAERNGNGGVGGGYRIFNFVSESQVNGVEVSGTVAAGKGGNGIGSAKFGGTGGGAVRVSLNLEGDAALTAGIGGNGQVSQAGPTIIGGAAGSGGAIVSSGVFAFRGSGTIIAGDAGALGSRPANGGSIVGDPRPVIVDGVPIPSLLVGVRGNQNITVIAGDGSHGGSGGSIRDVTFGSTAELLLPTPAGTVLVQAGNGSGERGFAGRGGSISGINGAVGSAPNLPTSILAGHGGGGATVSKSGDGGAITDVSLSRGGGAGIVVTIQAGDAGDSPLAKTGGKGGGVRSVGISDLDDATIVRSIGAGDGGNARTFGGLGGTIVDIRVQDHDIGVRTGQAFGYDRMGGVFVGAGGTGGLRAGLAGSLNLVSADSIAAIVAGRGNVPGLAETVTNVYVNGGETEVLLQRNGALVFNSGFRLSFGAEQTTLLPGGATAVEVKTALGGLAGIAAAGGVDVEVTPNGGYRITFIQNGQRVPISGVEQVGADVGEQIKGETLLGTAVETINGTQVLPITEVRSGQNPLVIVETVPGTSGFSTSEITQADPALFINEVQQLDLRALSVASAGQFDMSFGGDTTPTLAGNSSAAAIDAALNLLPSIIAIGGVTVAESVSLPRVFNITLLSGFDEAPILGNFFVQENQRLDLGTIAAFPTGSYVLTFLGNSTPNIPVTATAASVATALNALPSVVTVGGVTVTSPILGTFDIVFNTTQGKANFEAEGFVQELQLLNVGNFANIPAGQFTISFGDQTTASLPPNATPLQIQNALNALTAVQAAGNVVVTGGLQNTFSITFGNVGERVSLQAFGTRPEVQSLDLSRVTTVDTAEFTLHIEHVAKIDETIQGTSIPIPSTTVRNGVVTDLVTTTVANGSPNPNGSPEEQFLDLAQLFAFAGPFGEFYLEFPQPNGVPPLRTTFLPALATAGQIDAALDLIVNGGVTVVPDATANQAFSITFTNNGNQQQIVGIGGLRELQTLDTAQIVPIVGGEIVLTLGADSSVPLLGNANAGTIDAALDPLPNGALQNFPGVTVTAIVGQPNRYNVQFNDFGNVDQITGAGGGPLNSETIRLDLSQFAAVANATVALTFNNSTTAALPVVADAAQIQAALNALPSILAIRTGNTGAVVVTTVSPNVFTITFNLFGDQPDMSGLQTRGTGTTTRLPFNATPQQIEAALDAVSLADTTIFNGVATGSLGISFVEFSDQPLVTSVAFIHEKQKIDLYSVGSYQLSFNNENTGVLPVNASQQQVQDALNALTTVQGTGKTVTVKTNPDSSFSVVFGADNDQLPFAGVQFEDYSVTTGADGGASVREIQFLTPIKKGEFNSLFYRAEARLLGAIADINEIDANVFKSFTDANANGVFDLGVDALHLGSFTLGDIPIDGLVMARRFDQINTNVTPEAKMTIAGFFDNDNII